YRAAKNPEPVRLSETRSARAVLRAKRRAAVSIAFRRELLPTFSTHAAETGDVENLSRHGVSHVRLRKNAARFAGLVTQRHRPDQRRRRVVPRPLRPRARCVRFHHRIGARLFLSQTFSRRAEANRAGLVAR